MAKDAISILDGATFLVCDTRGDVDVSPDEPHGFFYRDTRYLSRWQLTANGEPLTVLSTDHVAYFSVKFFLVPPTGTGTRTRRCRSSAAARSATASTRT